MHRNCLIMIQALAAFAVAAATVPRISWSVDMEDPRTKRLEMVYGETIDLQCYFRNYLDALDITGAAVTLHGRTNNMAAGESFQVTGSAGASGLASVRVDVDAWLPQGLETVSYTLAVVQPDGINVLRAYGSIYLSGSSASTTNTPVPVSVYTALNTDLNNHITTAANQFTALSNNLAAAIFDFQSFTSTNQITQLWGSPTNYMDGAGNYWEISVATNITHRYVVVSASGPPGADLPSIGSVFDYNYADVSEDENTLSSNIYYAVTGLSDELAAVSTYYKGYGTTDVLWSYYIAAEDVYAQSDAYAWPAESMILMGEDFLQRDYTISLVETNAYSAEIVVSTNIIDRAARTNEMAVALAGKADAEHGHVINDVTGLQTALDGLDAAVAAIPMPPTNAVSGWLLYDTGSNMWLRVAVSNFSFKVYEVLP
jgi:hypothetical protein